VVKVLQIYDIKTEKGKAYFENELSSNSFLSYI